jgi:hypothetical protein
METKNSEGVGCFQFEFTFNTDASLCSGDMQRILYILSHELQEVTSISHVPDNRLSSFTINICCSKQNVIDQIIMIFCFCSINVFFDLSP